MHMASQCPGVMLVDALAAPGVAAAGVAEGSEAAGVAATGGGVAAASAAAASAAAASAAAAAAASAAAATSAASAAFLSSFLARWRASATSATAAAVLAILRACLRLAGVPPEDGGRPLDFVVRMSSSMLSDEVSLSVGSFFFDLSPCEGVGIEGRRGEERGGEADV